MWETMNEQIHERFLASSDRERTSARGPVPVPRHDVPYHLIGTCSQRRQTYFQQCVINRVDTSITTVNFVALRVLDGNTRKKRFQITVERNSYTDRGN